MAYTKEDARRLFDETSEIDVPRHIERACNVIDAGIYSGDAFMTAEALKRFEFWLARWSAQAVPYIKSILEETGE